MLDRVQRSIEGKVALPSRPPKLCVQADGRAPGFAEAVPQHHHKPSDVGAEGADENVSRRQLLGVRHYVHERPVPLAEKIRRGKYWGVGG